MRCSRLLLLLLSEVLTILYHSSSGLADPLVYKIGSRYEFALEQPQVEQGPLEETTGCWDVIYNSNQSRFGEVSGDGAFDAETVCKDGEFFMQVGLMLLNIPTELPAAVETVPLVKEASLNPFSWYLYFGYESKPVMVEQDPESTVLMKTDKGIRECLQGLLKGLGKKSVAIDPFGVEDACLRNGNIAIPDYVVAPDRLFPIQVWVRRKNHIQNPTLDDFGALQIVAVLAGRIEFTLCNQRVVSEAFYPYIHNRKLVYQANVFQPNTVRFPKLSKVKAECFSSILEEGQLLFVPCGFSVTSRTKTASIVAAYSIVNEVNWAVVNDRVLAQSLTREDEFEKVLASSKVSYVNILLENFKKESVSDWQGYARLQSFQEEAVSTAPPEVSFIQSTRGDLFFNVLLDGNVKISEIQTQYRATLVDAQATSYDIEKDLLAVSQLFGLVHTPYHQEDKPLVRVNISGLQIETEYAVRFRTVSKLRGIVGQWSEWRKVSTKGESPPGEPTSVVAKPCLEEEKNCVQVSWSEPLDLGGLDLEKYIVLHAEENFEHEYVVGSSFSNTLKVCHMRPEWNHQFRVVAVNSMGQGKPSSLSNIVSLKSKLYEVTAEHRRKFINDPDHSDEVESMLSLFTQEKYHVLVEGKAFNASSERAIITLSDTLQHIFVHDKDKTEKILTSFPAWAAHFSPKYYDVRAQVEWAVPKDGCSRLENDLYGRIVLIQRGDCAFVAKVQQATDARAMGVIIVDESGVCDEKLSHSCSQGGDKYRLEGFAKNDKYALWKDLKMPVVLISGKFLPLLDA